MRRVSHKVRTRLGLDEAGRGVTLRGNDFSNDDPGCRDPARKSARLGDLDASVGGNAGIVVVTAQSRKVGVMMERIGKADLVLEIFRVINGSFSRS